MTSLAAKIVDIIKNTGWIEKRGKFETGGGFKYAMAVDVYATIREKLSERGVASVVGVHAIEHQEVARGENKRPLLLTTVKGTLTLIDGESGEKIETPFVGAGADEYDKGAYKAITGGVRDAIKALFLLPTGDDPEAHPERDEAEVKRPATNGAAPTPPPVQRAARPNGTTGLTNAQKALIHARYRDVGIEAKNHIVAANFHITGKGSSTQMAQGDVDKIVARLQQPDAQEWADRIRADFRE